MNKADKLSAFINETLRMYNPASGLFTRVVKNPTNIGYIFSLSFRWNTFIQEFMP
jgi:cytochrome P450